MKIIENSDGDTFLDTEKIAEAAIESCSYLLVNIGFSPAEVGKLFLMASHIIADDADAYEGIRRELFHSLNNEFSEQNETRKSKFTIFEEVETQNFYKRLEVLGKRLESIYDVSDETSAEKLYDLIQAAIPLRLELVAWVREEAKRQGFKVVNRKFAWRETASDKELMNEENIFFLDDELKYRSGFHFNCVYQLSRFYEKIGSKPQLLNLKKLIHLPELLLEPSIYEELERQLTTAESFEALNLYIQKIDGPIIVMQSEFINNFSKDQKIDLSQYVVQDWLKLLDRQSIIKRYKDKGRWRIEIS